MLRRTAWAALAWLFLAGVGVAQTLTFPTLTGRVVDEAGLLSAADRTSLTAALAALEAKTTDQLVVVTLKSLQGTTIEDYGYQLGRRWEIGQKGKNNGVLLIVAAAERSVRIEVGYELEGTLTDAGTRLIIENSILPAFRTGDFPTGIKRGVDQIIRSLTGSATEGVSDGAAKAPAPSPSDIPGWLVITVILGVVGLIIFCAIFGGAFCRGFFDIVLQILFVAMSSSRSGSSGGASFSGGGGSFGGGGSSGKW